MHPRVKGGGQNKRLPSELWRNMCEMCERKEREKKKTPYTQTAEVHVWKLSQALDMLHNQTWLTDVWSEGPVLGKNHLAGNENQAFTGVADVRLEMQTPLPHSCQMSGRERERKKKNTAKF